MISDVRALHGITKRTFRRRYFPALTTKFGQNGSLRDVEELLEERGLNVDHTTVWRWVQYYGPELEQRLRQHLKPTNPNTVRSKSLRFLVAGF